MDQGCIVLVASLSDFKGLEHAWQLLYDLNGLALIIERFLYGIWKLVLKFQF